MERHEYTQKTSDRIQSIQLIEVGTQPQVPAPLIRITTCGLLTLEVVEEVVSTDPPLARYTSFTAEQLHGRGTAPALTLLKLLVSRTERFALKDWLVDAFCHDRELFSDVRLDNIVSQLRSLLCPPAYANLRTHLVTHLRGSSSSGNGYQLAAYPLIWVDSDALTWYVEQAVRMERFADDPLPYWERAYALAKRGPYLPDEAYSDWSITRRDEIAGLLRQSVQALAQLYLVRHGTSGEEEALLLLRSYWLEHLLEEDVLRPLMELLGQRERYHEALGCYQQLCTILEQENHQPDKQTQDLAAYLREKQIQRAPESNLAKSAVIVNLPFTKTPLLEIEATAKAHFQGFSPEKQLVNPPISEWPYSMNNSSRIELFQQFSSALMYSSTLDKTLLELLEQQTRILWKHRESLDIPLEMFYRQINDHLTQLKAFLEHSLLPAERIALCDLASRTFLLAGVVLYDMGFYPHARQAMHIATQASLESGNVVMHGLIYAWMSFTWTYASSFSLALPCILQAQSLVEQGIDSNAKAWVAAVQAEICAHLHRRDDCFQALQQAEKYITSPSDDTHYIFGLNEVLLDGYKGVCLQQFYQQHNPETHTYLSEAKEALERALQSETPSRRKRYYLGDLSKIEARCGEIETACFYATQSLAIPSPIESKSIWQRIVDLRALLQPYQQEASVKALEAHIQTQVLSIKIDKVR